MINWPDMIFWGAITLVCIVCGAGMFGGALLFFRAVHWWGHVGGGVIFCGAAALAVGFAFFVAAMIGLARL